MKDFRNGGLLALGLALILGGAGYHIVTDEGEAGPPATDGVGTEALASLPSGAPAPMSTAEPRVDIPVMQVWKSPTCGCCNGWIDHLRAEGIRVEVHETQAMGAVKQERGVPSAMGSCHTGVIGDYVVEGHVPAEDILRLLEEKPAVAGLAVPGMPMGSPGMDLTDHKEPYETLAFQKDGSSSVWASH